MPKVSVCVEVPEEHYRALAGEAGRRGVTVESLVQQTLQRLLEPTFMANDPNFVPHQFLQLPGQLSNAQSFLRE